jgi:predicted nucleic acid-binding protein
MPDAPPRYYWDANVFLSYIHEMGDRTAEIDALLDATREGKLEIVTSTLSIVEVAFGAEEELGGAMSPEIESAIDNLWIPPSPIRLVDFSPLLGRNARRLIRQARERGWSLKPADAIHLATAQQMAVKQFHTYERSKLDKYGPLCEFRVEEPRATQLQLPGTGRVEDPNQ